MALPIDGFKIDHVTPPKLGQSIPASVTAEISFTLPARHSQSMNLRNEWDELREHDIVFLVSIKAPNKSEDESTTTESTEGKKFPELYGITAIRGCEVSALMDEEGGVLSDPNPEKRPKFRNGQRRTLKVWLDPAQYQMDKNRKEKRKTENARTEEEHGQEGKPRPITS